MLRNKTISSTKLASMNTKLLLLFSLFCLGIAPQIRAQQKIQVSGNVLSENGSPLTGATVQVVNSSTITTTSENGNFVIEAPAQGQLSVTYVGFQNEIVPVSGRQSITITLKSAAATGEEVVVVGYSKQKKVNLTGAVAVVGGDELTKRPVLSTASALQGVLPGVTVQQSSGAPGSDAQIRIRGLGTLGNNDPLILIDGVVSSFADIDPNNIETISVLKDAASASIYGSRAAGGVILITSKRGKAGKMRVTYDGTVGFQKPMDLPNYLGAVDFMKLHNEALVNEGASPLYSDDLINNYAEKSKTDPDHFPDTDWQDVTMSNALQQQHNITLNGGTEKLRFMGAVNYMNQDGLIPNSNFKRYSLRMNTDYKATDKLSFAFDLNLRQQLTTEPTATFPMNGGEGVFKQMNRVPPIYPAVHSDGSWGIGWNGGNSLAWAVDGGRNTMNTRAAFINLQANYNPVKNLHLNFTFAPQFYTTLGRNVTNRIEYLDFDTKALLFAEPNRNLLTNDLSNVATNYLKFQANYTKEWDWLTFNALAGAEQTDSRREGFDATRVGTLFPGLQQLDAYPSLNQVINGSASEWALRSYFGRTNFVFLDKYLLEVNARYDGSSRFASDFKRYGFFPSVSAGWIVSKENFFENISFINLLKMRASYGSLGNQQIGNYPYIASINLGQGVLNGNIITTAAQTVANNREITWESTRVANIGFEAAFLKNKFNIEADYYIKKTDDILLTLPIPMTTGLNPAVQNAGKVENKGWDLNLTYNDRVGKDFRYKITGVLSDVKNKVTDLAGTGPYISQFQVTNTGLEMGSLYGLQALGLFQSQDEIARSATQFGTVKPGDIKYFDKNGDGKINADDRMVIGSRIPRYTYSLNLFAEFRNFDFTAFFQGVGKWNGYLNNDAAWAFHNAGKVQDVHLNRWSDSKTAEENAKATYPRFFIARPNNQQVSSYWMKDASFLKLKTVSIGYNFSSKTLGATPFENARIYVSGQNVLSWDKIKGFDPETPLGDANAYPQVSVYVVGVRLGLK